VRECLDEYLTWLQGHRKTGSDARYRIDTHIAPKLGDIQCNRLTTAEIQRWLRDLANSPARVRSKKDAKKPNFRELVKGDHEATRRRRASANRTLTVLKAALNRAWREGKVLSDDGWRCVEPFEQADGARARYLTVAEAKRLLNASDPDFRRLTQAALASGARYGELAALRARDFNPDSGTVHVRNSKSGKGRHIVLNGEGAALFKSLAAGKPRGWAAAGEGRRLTLEQISPSPPHDRGLQASKDQAAGIVSYPAAHVGFARGHGRRSADGGRAQSWPRGHADGRAALRPPGAKLH